MTRATKTAVTVAAVLGLIVGIVPGAYVGSTTGEMMGNIQTTLTPAPLSDFSAWQFKYAESARAREAVLLEIGILQQLERVNHNSVQEGRLGLAFARLAMIEEATDNQDAARTALDKARKSFKRLHPREDLSDAQLKDAVKRSDQVMERVRLF
jgi:hypothetical protein